MIFSGFGAAIWFAIVAVAAESSHSGTRLSSAAKRANMTDPSALLALWFAYPVVKALHELGHAMAVKRWGGEVHETGILFMVFMPVPYVDATASSVFPEKRRRMIVAAAGIGVELFLAALALFVWVAVEPGIVRQTAYAVMLVGGDFDRPLQR